MRKSELYCSNSCKQKAYRNKISDRSNQIQPDQDEEAFKELQKQLVNEVLSHWESKGQAPWQIRRNVMTLHRSETQDFLSKFSPEEQLHYVSHLWVFIEDNLSQKDLEIKPVLSQSNYMHSQNP